MSVNRTLPTGTVTFLFTDLEGSTRLLQAHPAAYREAVRRHHELLLEAVEASDGAVFETVGDAVYAAFARPELLHLVEMEEEPSALFGRRVDLVTRRACGVR